jgi:hypothetical protein
VILSASYALGRHRHARTRNANERRSLAEGEPNAALYDVL